MLKKKNKKDLKNNKKNKQSKKSIKQKPKKTKNTKSVKSKKSNLKTKKIKKIVKKIKVKSKVKSKVKKENKKLKNIKLGEVVGEVTHFYNQISVAVVRFKKDIKVGERVLFKGAHTEFEQVLKSVQINHQNVSEVKKNQVAGVKVDKRAREGDKVYLVS